MRADDRSSWTSLRRQLTSARLQVSDGLSQGHSLPFSSCAPLPPHTSFLSSSLLSPRKSSDALILLTVDASLLYCPRKYSGVENNEAGHWQC